jgi:hypothetical protein
MQNTVNAFQHKLGEDVKLLSGDPCTDSVVHMECARGYIDVRRCGSTVVCLLQAGASVEITDDGRRMCLNPTERSSGTFQACNGFEEAVDALLACAGWGA